MSKSKGTSILASDLLKDYSEELIRYFFIRYAPENHDIDFEIADIKTLNNNELVATLGNYIYRVLSYVKNKRNGLLKIQELDKEVSAFIDKTFTSTKEMLENASFSSSIMEIMGLAQFGNQYFNNAAPWKETDLEKVDSVLNNATAIVRALQLLLRPYIPSLSEKIAEMLNVESFIEAPGTWTYAPITLEKEHAIGEPTIPIQKLEIVTEKGTE